MTTLIPPLDHQRKNSGTHLMFIIVLLFILWYFDTAVTASFVIKGFEWPHSWLNKKWPSWCFPFRENQVIVSIVLNNPTATTLNKKDITNLQPLCWRILIHHFFFHFFYLQQFEIDLVNRVELR